MLVFFPRPVKQDPAARPPGRAGLFASGDVVPSVGRAAGNRLPIVVGHDHVDDAVSWSLDKGSLWLRFLIWQEAFTSSRC
jgi:hypothetical protein